MTTELTMPRVHLNGTSKDELLRLQLDAMRALDVAEKVLEEAAPNARDFYVISPDAYKAARKEHGARLESLKAIRAEVLKIAEAIDGQ